MGGLGPGIGGMEYVVIAIVALLVVGPERLPALLNKLGKMVAKARNMASEFRASFDEMARQSELDDLRKEVEALRRTQTNMMPLGAEAEATFKSIRDDLAKPVGAPTPASPATATAEPVLPVAEWPDPVAAPNVETAQDAAPAAAAKARKPRSTAKAAATPSSKRAPAAPKTPAKPRAPRKKAADQ